MTEPTPNGVPCRHCGLPIDWDEVCWIHRSGWADCHVEFSGGEVLTPGPVPENAEFEEVAKAVIANHAGARNLRAIWNPEIVTDGRPTTLAEPEGDWS